MTNIEIIETLYSAFRNKDDDTFRTLCCDDIEWIQNEGFPNGGHHHGADAVIENVFHQFEKDWNYFKFKVEEMFESQDGSKVTSLVSISGSINKLGKPWRPRRCILMK